MGGTLHWTDGGTPCQPDGVTLPVGTGWGYTPGVNRQTRVKTLPSPFLWNAAVKICVFYWISKKSYLVPIYHTYRNKRNVHASSCLNYVNCRADEALLMTPKSDFYFKNTGEIYAMGKTQSMSSRLEWGHTGQCSVIYLERFIPEFMHGAPEICITCPSVKKQFFPTNASSEVINLRVVDIMPCFWSIPMESSHRPSQRQGRDLYPFGTISVPHPWHSWWLSWRYLYRAVDQCEHTINFYLPFENNGLVSLNLIPSYYLYHACYANRYLLTITMITKYNYYYIIIGCSLFFKSSEMNMFYLRS